MRGAPKKILPAHLPDQRAQFRLDRRSPPVDAISNANSGESRLDANQRFGSNNHENRKDRPAIELSEELAVVVRETSPALQLTPQDHQLMSERGILSLTLDLRLEW